MTTNVNVKAYGGNNVQAKLIGIYAEKGTDGHVFYKTEVQGFQGTAAVSFIYDVDEALEEFCKVARKMLVEQKEILIAGDNRKYV